jgi:hypothetical protein
MAISERSPDLAVRPATVALPPPLRYVDAEDPQPRGLGRRELRCTTCGYGAVAKLVPERCPMCSGVSWDFTEWRPFSSQGNRPA